MSEELVNASDEMLLKHYVEKGNQQAFAAFVNRHVDMAFSVAMRSLNGDASLAQDVTQKVFSDAASDASRLIGYKSIAAWIFTSARFAASKEARSQRRRAGREQSAIVMKDLSDNSEVEPAWERIRPVIDDAMEDLGELDRDAVILRYFENLDYKTIGLRLGLSANTARMRADRALDKLQIILGKKGMASVAGVLSSALSGYAVSPAPAGVASIVSAKAIGSGAAAVSSLWMLFNAIKIPLATSMLLGMGGSTIYLQDKENQENFRQEIARLGMQAEVGLSGNQRDRQARDEIERAYAVLDRDATVLAEYIAVIDAGFQSSAKSPKDHGNPYRIGELDAPPKAIRQAVPQYPESLHGLEVDGEVVVEFTIGVDGKARDLETIEASHPEFLRSALLAVAKWEFEPGQVGSGAVDTRARIKIGFPSPSKKAKTDDWF